MGDTPDKRVAIYLKREQWAVINAALLVTAHDIAGHSQAPDLIATQDTEEFELRRYIKQELRSLELAGKDENR